MNTIRSTSAKALRNEKKKKKKKKKTACRRHGGGGHCYSRRGRGRLPLRLSLRTATRREERRRRRQNWSQGRKMTQGIASTTSTENDTVAFVDEVVDVVVAMDNGDDGDGVLERASRSASALASSTGGGDVASEMVEKVSDEEIGTEVKRYGTPWMRWSILGRTWRLEVGKLRAHRCGR